MKLSEYLKQNNMTTKDYFEMQNRRSKGKMTLTDYRREKKNSLSQTINFDTFESDLNAMGTTIKSIYDGWQTPETMNNTRVAVEGMQTRINAYMEYQKMFGGADLTDVANAYQNILGDWDNRTSVYGQFKNADAYATEKKRLDLSDQFRVKTGTDAKTGEDTYRGLTFDEVQAELKKYAPDSDEYKFLSTYTGYTDLNDFNKAIENAKQNPHWTDDVKKAYDNWEIPKAGALNEKATKEKGVIIYYTQKDVEEATKARDSYMKSILGGKTYEEVIKPEGTLVEKLERQKTIWALDNSFDLYKDVMQNEDFEEKSQYWDGHTYATSDIESVWSVSKGNTMVYDKDTKTYYVYSDPVYEYVNDVNNARRNLTEGVIKGKVLGTEYANKGYDALYPEEIATFNYIDREEGRDAALKFLTDMEKTLTRRKGLEKAGNVEEMVDSNGWAATGLSLATIPANIVGGFGNLFATIDETISGKEYNPYHAYRKFSNFATDTRQYVSENIAESTKGWEFAGQNIPSFLYNTAMSMGDSVVGAATMGKFYTPLMGMTAAQQKAKELYEQGESNETIVASALASGLAEAVFEYASVDKLLKIKNIDSFKRLTKEALKQAGVEGSEEMFTEISNILSDTIIRGDNSEIAKQYDELKRRGFSESEINLELAKKVGSQIGWAGVGGFLSGIGLGGGKGAINLAQNYSKGKDIRGKDRVGDMLDTVKLTPTESAAYEAYNEYVGKGINADNITNAQLGNLYNLTSPYAKVNKDINRGIERVDTDNVELKRAKELAKSESGKSANIEGIKIGDETTIVTPDGEVSLDKMSLNQKDAEVVAYAESIGREYGEDVANLFIEQYDGQTDVSHYANSFNLVMEYAKHNYTQDTILENKGVLSYAQVKNVYEATVKATFDAQQKAINDITEKQGKTVFVQGKFDDSIIDYDNKTTDGSKVRWDKLNTQQRRAIKFVQLFAKATGVNITLTKSNVVNGKHKGENGSYDPKTNTITIDVYAGRIDATSTKDAILPTLSHEMTHWMKAKAPAIYESIRNDIFGVLANDSRIASDERVLAEMQRMKKAHPDQDVTPEDAIDEIVARACEDMLKNSNTARKLLAKMSVTEQQTFIDKVKETFENLMQWINDLLSQYKSDSYEARFLNEYKTELKKISKQWDAMLKSAIESNQALQNEGTTGEKLTGQVAKAQKNTTDDGDVKNADRITENMSEEERYEILKNRDITLTQPNIIEYSKIIKNNPALLDKRLKTKEAEKILKKIGEEFGVFTEYRNNDVELQFEFGKNNLSESVNKQKGNYDKYAQMLSCFSDVISNAIGIECHNRNNEGYKPDKTLKMVYVLCSVFETNNEIVPVKLEIKEFIDKPNRLYVAVAVEGIKKDRVAGMGVPNNRSHVRTSPATISIRDLFSKINPKDVDFLKYIPNEFLSREQIEAKSNAKDVKNADRDIQFKQMPTDKGDVRFMERESLSDACETLETITDKDYKKVLSKAPFVLVMDYTPQIVLDAMKEENPEKSLPANNRRILIRRDALYLAVRGKGVQEGHYHELGAEALKRLPEYLEKPDAIIKTNENNKRRLVLSHINAKNGQAIISVEFESSKDYDGHNEFFNVIITVFDLHENYFKRLFRKNDAEIKYEKEDLEQVNPQLYKWLRTFNSKSSKVEEGIKTPSTTTTNIIRNGNKKSQGKFPNQVENEKNAEYNNWESYELTSEFLQNVPFRERHVFLRSLANKTNGLKRGERRNIVIITDRHVYFYKANGYMNGNIVKRSGLTKKANAEIKAWSDFYGSIDTGTTTSSQMAEDYESGRRRNDWDYDASPNSYPTRPNDEVVEQSSGSNPVGDTWEGNEDFGTDEELIVGSIIYNDNGESFKVTEDGLVEIVQFSDRLEKTVYDKSSKAEETGIQYSDRQHYWKSGFSHSEMSYVERIAKHEVEATDNYIDAENKWLYNDRKEKPYFALYSTAHIDNPTVMYASKGSRAINEYKWFMRFIETLRSVDNGDYEQSTRVLNKVLEDFWNDRSTNNRNSGNALGRGNNIRNVGTLNAKSNFRPSEALFNCLRNIAETQERGNGVKQFSDRMEETVYDKMGETKRILKENEKLKADVERLIKVIGNEEISVRRFRSLADFLKNRTGNNVNREELGDMLKEVYTFIQSGTNVEWQDVIVKTKEIADYLINKDLKVPYDYFKDVMAKVRKDTFSLSQEQRSKAEEMFGGYGNFHKYVFGRINVTTNESSTSLAERWKQWSKQYPGIFDADVKGAEQVEEIVHIVNTLKDTSSLMEEFEREEAIRYLSTEIYNQFWNIAAESNEIAKESRAKHRQMMEEIRNDYNKRQSENILHPIGENALKYEALYKKMLNHNKAEIKKAKQHGKEKLAEYKERSERKTKIQSITANALALNKMLVKNSKEEHINEALKGPVIALLQAIDFSSKRMLDKNIPTQKDISLSKTLSKVKDMMAEASVGKEELVELYGHDMDEDIKKMVDSVDDVMRSVGDNEFVLNQMSLEGLETLDKIIKTIKHTVTKMNEFHTVNHTRGIANLSREAVTYLDSLGKDKIYDGLKGDVKKLLNWDHALPCYVFKRFGSGGQKIFEAFQEGWDKFSFHIKKIIEFAKDTYTSKEVQEWSEEIKTFKILEPVTDVEKEDPDYKPKYQTVQMTIPQIMTLYCLNKREQARGHMLGGGIRIADIKPKKGDIISQSEGIILTSEDISTIISKLSKRQIEVADKLQKFINVVCSVWGNEVSMKRFGYKAFDGENYFPIESDKNNIATEDDTNKSNNLLKLLNMSFTKSLTEGANNRIVIRDIFDVFAQHTTDMAKYNALALPVLDAFKWYNYKEKIAIGDTAFKTHSVKQSIETAFGKDGQNYFITFLRDINGDKEVSRDTLGGHFFTNAKIAAVGFNLRVIFLQPISYIRASAIIDNKYLSAALLHKPKINNAKQYCGMALWKSMGYYDTDIQRGVKEQIKHSETFKDKATEFSMKGAQFADELTWGYLWNACELEIRRTRKDLNVGSDEFYSEISKRLREVIYATQVVDSTMTRSQMMRSSGTYEKMLTAFASEPTLAYNMVLDVYTDMRLDGRTKGKKIAFKNHGKKMARVLTAYTLTNIMAALIEAGFDAFRDDDEEEMDLEEFMKLFLFNFASDMSLTAKIPYIKEMHSVLNGFGTSRTDTEWMESFASTLKGWVKIFNGEGNPETVFKNTLKTASNLSGVPFYNAYRDLMATLNKLDILTAEELEELFEDWF